MSKLISVAGSAQGGAKIAGQNRSNLWRAGRVKSSHTIAFGGAILIQVGMSRDLMISSIGYRRLSMFGVVLKRNVSLCTNSCAKAVYVAWG